MRFSGSTIIAVESYPGTFMSKRKLTRQQKWRIEKVQKERIARADKRESELQSELKSDATQNTFSEEREGLIIAHFGVQVEVESAGHMPPQRYRCHVRANLPSLVTGDQVIWREGKNKTGVITARLPRTNALSRPDMQGRLRPVAANIDFIFIVVAPLPQLHSRLIDRYLAAAENMEIEPVILLNKTDLLVETNRLDIEKKIDFYATLGYRVLYVSTQTKKGIEKLQKTLNGKSSVFAGQSGVGKSSLVNLLLPEENTKVGELSDMKNKGRHTTTTARLFHMPCGGRLIDSPGVREFGLWHMKPEQVLNGFREFQPFIGQCKFRNCRHKSEPGCALSAALLDNKITQERFDSYHAILNAGNAM